jgi:uncharacterized protein HemY
MMRNEFLKKAYPMQYQQMAKSGRLQEHLSQTGEEAMEMWDYLLAQMSNSPSLPESYPERVKMLEAIPEQVREMVNAELIHLPLPRA